MRLQQHVQPASRPKLALSFGDNKQIPASRRRYNTEIGEAVAADAATSEVVASVVHAKTSKDKPHWRIDVSNGDLGMPLPQLLRKVARLDPSAPSSAVQLPGWIHRCQFPAGRALLTIL